MCKGLRTKFVYLRSEIWRIKSEDLGFRSKTEGLNSAVQIVRTIVLHFRGYIVSSKLKV